MIDNKDNLVDLSPTTEKSKRINKTVIAIIVIVLSLLTIYLVFGGKTKQQKAAPEQIAATANTSSFITAEDMQKLAADAEGSKKAERMQSSTSDRDLARPQQQRQLSASEKMEIERQRRAWENAQKEQDLRAKEDTAGQRSEIFFKIPALDQKSGKSSEPAVNQYYNSGDDNYIQVVGERSGHRR